MKNRNKIETMPWTVTGRIGMLSAVRFAVAALALTAMGLANTAWAAPPATAEGEAKPGESAAKTPGTTTRESKIKGKGTGNIRVNDADARAVEDLGQMDIEGKIHKPAVFYMLARVEVQYAGIEFKQNFTDRIVRGALKRPF